MLYALRGVLFEYVSDSLIVSIGCILKLTMLFGFVREITCSDFRRDIPGDSGESIGKLPDDLIIGVINDRFEPPMFTLLKN